MGSVTCNCSLTNLFAISSYQEGTEIQSNIQSALTLTPMFDFEIKHSDIGRYILCKSLVQKGT